MSIRDRVERACERIAARNGWTYSVMPLTDLDEDVLAICFAETEYYCLLFLVQSAMPGDFNLEKIEAEIESMVPDRANRWSPYDLSETLH